MDHRALHGRENALLLLVVLIHGCPSAFANPKASEFRRDIECEEIVAHSNFEGRAGLRLRPDLEAWEAITRASLERRARRLS